MMNFHSNISVGYGKAHSSFGELLQGRLKGDVDFLVTLPIDMWSICNLTSIRRNGPLVINCEYFKSARVAEMLLDKLGIKDGYELTISFSRNIPVGKGLSSSTADMLSTIRALQEVFGFLLREKTISEIFTSIEPHDGLMYKSCVVYNHRKGELIEELVYIPEYWLIAIDFGGEINTIEYNAKLNFTPEIIAQYDQLLHDLEQAFAEQNDAQIAACATGSTALHLNFHQHPKKLQVFNERGDFEPLGVVNTHSGTCLGFLYPKAKTLKEINALAEQIQSRYNLPVFVTNTLKLLI
jgi:uncharacterized protein involved in propanediol utilization